MDENMSNDNNNGRLNPMVNLNIRINKYLWPYKSKR